MPLHLTRVSKKHLNISCIYVAVANLLLHAPLSLLLAYIIVVMASVEPDIAAAGNTDVVARSAKRRRADEMATISQLPEQTVSYRQRLFLPTTDPLEMDRFQFLAYWPYVDNVWRKYSKSENHDEHTQTHTQTEWYHCIFAPLPQRESKSRGIRNKPTRAPGTCPIKMKLIKYCYPYASKTEPVFYRVQSVLQLPRDKNSTVCREHDHTLSEVDACKRPSAVKQPDNTTAVPVNHLNFVKTILTAALIDLEPASDENVSRVISLIQQWQSRSLTSSNLFVVTDEIRFASTLLDMAIADLNGVGKAKDELGEGALLCVDTAQTRMHNWIRLM